MCELLLCLTLLKKAEVPTPIYYDRYEDAVESASDEDKPRRGCGTVCG